ncbi:hypothetical protein KUTeg_016712 [Tegillarca granosa]|uniref:F-box domain-containing protein n=1 Tax=Tegillarca granosa TaxID=220873 RepID=A0ABQ9EQG2_TEGGR|nr:hypothetical protein KUTeg_016712 [Tegillarca granosa]
MLTGLNCLDKRCDLRMPITVDILQKILQSLPVGELVSHSNKEVKHALQVGNIRFVSHLNALEVIIPHSKTDQFSKCCVILIPATRLPVCAFTAVKSGNAIGQFSKSIALIHRILKTIKTLFTILPYKKIVWSQIVPRLSWRGEINHASANKVRLRINRIISKYVICNGGFYVRYPELIEKNVSLFDQGGNSTGNVLFTYSNDIVSPTDGESGPWLYF